ncbi:hypothetical protein GPECTOR_56g372 [Gonium pectorale]|uniref:Sulfotransferase family protein n=1 Tax=Gonium pectorale TaxID=33097 RepID=A0A150G5W4_GONPE|nr:hypothetical protein GPECTOR_56g372 [Gonium pectorale]|eukprot:KXZ45276.1 hypothetical protein GPECTOR_56g372 [Gonium pectorale]
MAEGIQVIGAGFGRTSTLSLKTALDVLGYKTFHMKEAARNQAAGRPIDWQPIYGPGGYTATVDWPSARFYKELFAANPNAKVILTVRESASKWYDSVLETIWQAGKIGMGVRPPPYLVPFFRTYTDHYTMVNEVIWGGTFQGRIEDREYAIKVYEQHIAEVKRSIPADRLLVFQAREGWGPLCQFLGQPVPDVPYPNVNDAAEFHRFLGKRHRRARLYRAIIAGCNAALCTTAAVGAAVLAGRVAAGRRPGRGRGGKPGSQGSP